MYTKSMIIYSRKSAILIKLSCFYFQVQRYWAPIVCVLVTMISSTSWFYLIISFWKCQNWLVKRGGLHVFYLRGEFLFTIIARMLTSTCVPIALDTAFLYYCHVINSLLNFHLHHKFCAAVV